MTQDLERPDMDELQEKLFNYVRNYYARHRRWPDPDTAARGLSRGVGPIMRACVGSPNVQLHERNGDMSLRLPYEPPPEEPRPTLVRRTVNLTEPQDAEAQRLAALEDPKAGLSGVIRNALDAYLRGHQ